MFFNWFEMLAIECDSPPYAIVRSCRKLGFHAPEDVRWCHTRHAHPTPSKQREGRLAQFVKSLFRRPNPQRPGCVCHGQLPPLVKCTFTLPSGRKEAILLGQCRRCQTMYWQEP